jgi:hypothetical protein
VTASSAARCGRIHSSSSSARGSGGGQQQTPLAQAFDQGFGCVLRLALQLQPVQLRQLFS